MSTSDHLAHAEEENGDSAALVEQRETVRNVFYFIYILTLWTAIVATAFSLANLNNVEEVLTTYCAERATATYIQNSPKVNCIRYHSHAIFAEAQLAEISRHFPLIAIPTLVALYILLIAVRSFLGLHFAVNDSDWNLAQAEWFQERRRSRTFATSLDIFLGGLHVALLGLLALTVKGSESIWAPIVLLIQSFLTAIYNFVNRGAFRRVLANQKLRTKFALILFVDLVVFSFSLLLLLTAWGGYGNWTATAFIASSSVVLFVIELVCSYASQIRKAFRLTGVTVRSVFLD